MLRTNFSEILIMETKQFLALKGFIVYKGKILIIKESANYITSLNKGKYDVVGGKVKVGERFNEGLMKEIKEETGLTVTIGKPFSIQEWRPIINGIENHIVGTFIECFSNSDQVTLDRCFDNYLWIDPKSYKKYNLIDSVKLAFKDYISR